MAHDADCPWLQDTSPHPPSLAARLPDADVLVQIVRPRAGDVVVLNIREPVPEAQLRAFRRQVYDKLLGMDIVVLITNVPAGIDIAHLTREQRLELLHDNKVVLAEDGTPIQTLRAIGDEEG